VTSINPAEGYVENTCAICGAFYGDDPTRRTPEQGDWTWHWDAPTGTTMVAESCGTAHGELVEQQRDDEGVLTSEAIAGARQAWLAAKEAAHGAQ